MDFKFEHLLCTIVVLFVLAIFLMQFSEASARLLVYGKNVRAVSGNLSLSEKVIDFVVGLTVPKAYFVHFYIFFLLALVIKQTILINFVRSYYEPLNRWTLVFYESFCHESILTKDNYKNLTVVSLLLFAQALKRLYEDLFICKFSNSRMNVLHYIFGITYYGLLVSINLVGLLPYYIGARVTTAYKLSVFDLDAIDWMLIAVFLSAQIDQFQNHVHLSKLVKYTIPTFRFFQYVASPHYLDEIVIYTVILVLHWRSDGIVWLKIDISMVWLLVVSNLAVSAGQTYQFYRQKFRESFRTPKKLVPFIW